MSRTPNIVNIIDLEATCWEGAESPEDSRQEIIEIGLAVVSVREKEIQKTESILVEPVQSEVSKFCEELTSLTQERLEEEGISFYKAKKELYENYDSDARPFASWGNFDRRAFKRDCKVKNVGYPFCTHMNVKTLDAWEAELKNEKGLRTAMRRRNLEFEGEHHRGEDDAYNVAKVLLDIFS